MNGKINDTCGREEGATFVRVALRLRAGQLFPRDGQMMVKNSPRFPQAEVRYNRKASGHGARIHAPNRTDSSARNGPLMSNMGGTRAAARACLVAKSLFFTASASCFSSIETLPSAEERASVS
jgi:hypothetical protein